jgi:glycosyltransferase involved in cell wall biosynthesis
MKICFITKYPPIQGGVSANCYWTARGLAEKGHNVFVITNANEVESRFRIHLTDEDINGEYAREFPETGGSVKVYSTEPANTRKIFFIPQNNPTVSRLAAIATDVIQKEGCEVIFASYFEPYCVAAQLASFWTETPLVVRHAGSDLYHLFENPELQSTYLNLLKRANRVTSGGGSAEKLRSFGVQPDRIATNVYSLPEKFFNPESSNPHINDFLIDNDSIKQTAELRNSEFESCFLPLENDSLPVLGIYGKIGEAKGTFDLLHAMSRLVKDGFPFYLATMSNGWVYKHFLDLVKTLDLTRYVKFIPFRPNWRVPEFIHSCNAVAYLERDFPIVAHTPMIPTEIVNSGGCLITTEEIAFKQSFRTRIKNFENAIIVPHPKDHESLARAVRFALEDTARARDIGKRGNSELKSKALYENYIENMESLLVSVASETTLSRAAANDKERVDTVGLAEAVQKLFPPTFLMLDDNQIESLKSSLFQVSPDKLESFDKNILDEITGELYPVIESGDASKIQCSKELYSYGAKLFEWKTRRLIANKEKENVERSIFVSARELGSLYLSIYGEFEIIDYRCNVTEISAALVSGEPVSYADSPVKIIFHSYSLPQRLNKLTESLLRMIAENSKTGDELFELICEQLGDFDKASTGKLKKEYLTVLESLYWSEMIKVSRKPA